MVNWFSVFTEATVITSPAGHLDVTVGESIVLPCQVSHDPTLDLKFTWFFNEQLIHFGSLGAYFEKVGGVSTTPGLKGGPDCGRRVENDGSTSYLLEAEHEHPL